MVRSGTSYIRRSVALEEKKAQQPALVRGVYWLAG